MADDVIEAGQDGGEGHELQSVPPWQEQITVRGLLVSLVLGVVFCIITHKLSLTVGVIPSLNIAAGLLGFFFVKSWTELLGKLGFSAKPFTRQENTVIQTCVVACYGIAFSGGFGSYVLAMNKRSYKLIGPDYPGNNADDVKDPSLGWMTTFLFACSFIGLLALVPLRKIMVIDYKLTYPSGTATALLINSFHTSEGAETANKQVNCLGNFFAGSFLWSAFKWFFSGSGNCGFENFPIFGLKAFANSFYFDFSATYIGVGLICSHVVNISVLLGAIVSWGILWPIISSRAGDWYPAGLENNDFKGLYGYKVFISVALILGDGLYNLLKIVSVTVHAAYTQWEFTRKLPTTSDDISADPLLTANSEMKLKNQLFMKEGVPFWIAGTGYLLLSIISMIVVPSLFHQVKWYYVLVCYLLAPALGFCNAYGAGLTDWSLASTYGKIGLFLFAAWAGNHGGVIAGLAACGVMMSIVSTASDLMQDFKTGYLTLSSPRSMFVSQLAGTVMGCIVAPLTFWMFWTAFDDIGLPDGEYKAPYAVIFRQMAIIGVEGLTALPRHCLELCIGFFIFAILLNLARDLGPSRVAKLLPIPMAMAIPFYIGAYFAIDMFIGTLILFVWEQLNKSGADTFATAVASGLICGDGIWTVPSALLALLKVKPPLCMTFLPTGRTVGH